MENEKDFVELDLSETPEPVSGAEAAAMSDATVVVAAADNELGSGVGEAVIDREEWNKIVADVDAKQAEAAKKEKKQRKRTERRKRRRKSTDFSSGS